VNSSLSHQSPDLAVAELAGTYLAELEHAGRSAHTLRAYRSELARPAAFSRRRRRRSSTSRRCARSSPHARVSAATRARTHTVIASFLAWAYRHEAIDADPMARIERVRVPAPAPRGLPARGRCRRCSP